MSETHLGRAAELLALARERMRMCHLALRTEQAYLQWLQRYVDFHGGRHPQELGAPELEQFLTHLAVHRKVASATQHQALQALLFLYRHALGIELPWLERGELIVREGKGGRDRVTMLPAALNNSLCAHLDRLRA